MDELPDLQSDADVDALMARLRAKAGAAATPGQGTAPPVERSGNALRDFLAVQEEYASAVFHAMQVIADALEDMQDQADGRRISRASAGEARANGASAADNTGTRDRRPAAGRSGPRASRINGRRRTPR
jgi:hypothetical protein